MNKTRQIKFRIWDTSCQKFIKRNEPSFITNEGKLGYFSGSPYYYYHDDNLKNLIIQQFTGLKDNKGIEIYEGDIVEMKTYRPILNGQEEITRKSVKWDFYTNFGFELSAPPNRWEIIGNIFENPELLGAEIYSSVLNSEIRVALPCGDE